MHILDVISSFSRSSKCTKFVGGWSFVPDSTRGVYSISPDPLTGFKGPTSKWREGERKGRKDRRYNDLCPRVPETLVPPLAFIISCVRNFVYIVTDSICVHCRVG